MRAVRVPSRGFATSPPDPDNLPARYRPARYKVAPGKYRTLADGDGEVLRFRAGWAAEQAADEEEAKVRRGRWHDPAAASRAQACWVPIVPGLTPHGPRHTHRTITEEAGTPPKLMDERLGHEDGSVQARHSHVTPRMRAPLMDAP